MPCSQTHRYTQWISVYHNRRVRFSWFGTSWDLLERNGPEHPIGCRVNLSDFQMARIKAHRRNMVRPSIYDRASILWVFLALSIGRQHILLGKNPMIGRSSRVLDKKP